MLNSTTKATPIATPPSQHLPQSFFARLAEQVAPELIGCLLVKHQPDGELLRLARSWKKRRIPRRAATPAYLSCYELADPAG